MRRVLAIVGLRARLLARRSRGLSGVIRAIVTLVLIAMGGLFAAGLAVGFGLLTYAMIETGDERGIRVGFVTAFYTFFIFGVILPILTGAMNPGFDAAPLRIFPFTRPGLYGVTLAATALGPEHLIYYPALAAVVATGVISPGIHPVAGGAVVALLVLLYAAWGNTCTLLVNVMMRKRRAREIVGIAGITAVVILSLLPALLDVEEGQAYPLAQPILEVVGTVAKELPPSQAGTALTALHFGNREAFLVGLLGLASWGALGLLVGYRVFTGQQFEGADQAPAGAGGARLKATRRSEVERRLFESRALRLVPVVARAVAGKELRYLFRSVVGRFNLLIAPLFVVFVAWMFGRADADSFLGQDLEEWMLFGMIAYATLFSNNFLANCFAWERGGLRTYLLAPVALRDVLLGKNIAVWIYNAILLALILAVWSSLRGLPSPMTLLLAILLYTICLLAFTTVGNLVSIAFPVSRDISSVRNAPSQVGTLLSLVSLSLILGLVGLTLLVPLLLGVRLLQPVALLVLLAIVVGLYRMGVRFAGELFDERREQLLAGLRILD